MNNDCLFCAIATGTIPSIKVYETDAVLAFLDISPVEKGHTLVISKRAHSETILDTPPDIATELLAAAKTVAAGMMAAGFGGVNLVQNNFKDGGQAVPHIHFHVIPRAKDRQGPLVWASGSNPYADDAERNVYAERIRAGIEAAQATLPS